MNRSIVSVVLPFYQAENTLERAVKSILSQTFTDFELLLVDNNSMDRSVEIARQMALTDSRIKVFHEKEQGVVFAMNRGMQEARGKFIARMDADDVSLPERLEKQFRFLQQHPQFGLVGSRVKHVSPLPSKGLERFVKWVNSFHTSDEIFQNRLVEIPIIQPTVMFRAELVGQYGAYREGDFPEDYELFLRWLDAGVLFYQLPELLHEWHDSETRLTRTDERYSPHAFYKTKAYYFARWFLRTHPQLEIWVWGAGRKSRQRARLLEEQGVTIRGYYDLNANKTAERLCRSYVDIPEPGRQFILSMVGNHGARDQIESYLKNRHYQPGTDFLLMA
ncbi:glycosyltransferase family 2 protein [Sunxiuqinia sp. sy24]|uniref:glycosyltransferase family 2 protein n=1 Tax=Sunxiuqinia sp. sy24 TaxID=3461495 RepID=UPI00404529FD